MALTKINRGGFNTGISDSSDANAITIDASEKVGIGTASPSTKLHVDGGGSQPEIRVAQNSTYYTDIGVNHIDVNGPNDLRFLMGGAQKARLTSGGVLALGSGTPGSWSTNYPALQIGQGTTFTGHKNNTQTQLGQNWWIGTGNQYVVNGAASRLIMNPDSTIIFSQAPSGTAGATMSTINDRLVIAPSGNVGIGASTPECKINIFGESTSNWADNDAMYNKDHPAFLKITNGQETTGVESGIVMRSKTSGAGVWSMYTKQTASYLADLHFRGRNAGTTSAVRMTLKSDGNVGIGNTSPAQLLEVTGSGATIRVESTDNNQEGIEFYQNNTKNASIMWGQGNANLEIKNFRNDQHASNLYANIDFFTGGSNATSPNYNPNLVMRITDDGNVHLTTGVNVRIQLGTSGTGATGAGAVSVSDNSVYVRGNDDDLILGAAGNGNIFFKENADTRMTIEPGGNVGIGTTNPSYKLHVNSGATNVVADFESTDGTAAIRLRDNAGNVELSTVGNVFRVQPGGGTAAMEVSTGGASWDPTNSGSYGFSAHGQAHLTIQTGTYTGSGGGTNIAQSNVQIVNSAFGALVFIRGYNPTGYPTAQFCDLIYFGYNASPTIIAQQTVAGSPPNRIYTGSGYALYLRYSSNVITTRVSYIQSS